MTLGEKIKELRTKKGLTQKELADEVHVTFQTVSKWEKDENEPDVATLKELAKIFSCSIDDLVDNETTPNNKNDEQTKIAIAPVGKIEAGTCRDCGKKLYSGDAIHHMSRKSEGGVTETVDVCEDCFKRHEELNKQRLEIMSGSKKKSSGLFSKIGGRDDSSVIVWSIIIGALALITTFVLCICFYSDVGLGWTIGAPLIACYVFVADIYCIFSGSWIGEAFLGIASWSVKFPGIIFTFDLEGLKFLIIMKLLFWVLGVIIGIGAFLFAVGFATICSVFAFPFLLVYNKKNY